MTAKLKPNWAGNDLLSKLVNGLIQTKPIYALMKQQARQVLIKTAEKNGIPWRQTVQDYEASPIRQRLEQVSNPNITYPNYYRMPFHAYDAGNLCWQAAFEAESATHSMALRVWPQENLSWQAAQCRLRDSFHQVLKRHGPSQPRHVLDIGCSVGISTLALHQFYRKQGILVETVGLDLSPYMLSVAQERDSDQQIEWIHAKAEQSGLLDRSFDLITLQFVIHELPQQASRDIFQEALRLLRSGGSIAIVDNNPQSKVIQNLPPVLFTLMKSTEPWSDEYYTFEVEAALRSVGFEGLVTTETDPRHRTIMARKPSGA